MKTVSTGKALRVLLAKIRHGVRRQPSRLQGNRACADEAAQGSLRRAGVVRCGICRYGGCREGETHDTDNLRESPERPSLDVGAEGEQPTEVEGAQPRGTRLRFHGAYDGRPNLQRGRDDKGKSQHRIDKLSTNNRYRPIVST